MDKKTKERVFKLRKIGADDLKKSVDKLKEELGQLRIAKVSGGTASKLTRIKVPDQLPSHRHICLSLQATRNSDCSPKLMGLIFFL